MSTMANYWADKGWWLTLLTMDDGAAPSFYDLRPGVRHIPLRIAVDSRNSLVGLWNNLQRILILRRAIRESNPDAVISFVDKTNVSTLLATWGLNVDVVVSERVDPGSYSLGLVWDHLRRWAYSWADSIVVQTTKAREYFSRRCQGRIAVIPNPVVLPGRPPSGPDHRPGNPSVVAMGRLAEQKGFDLLLHAFARLAGRHPDWTMMIIGEGPLRASLESLRDELGISDRVDLPGIVEHPHECLQEASLFVLSSRFEGFPNALCEAMACGLAVIAADCPSGPRDIVRDGENGLLIPSEDVEALTGAMDRLMSNDAERKRLALRAREVVERFSLPKVMAMWENVLHG